MRAAVRAAGGVLQQTVQQHFGRTQSGHGNQIHIMPAAHLEPFAVNLPPILRGNGHQRTVRVCGVPRRTPAVAEEPVTMGVEEFRERCR